MSNNFKLNIFKSPVDERDFVAETIFANSNELPEEYDLRDQLQPVRNQGSTSTCAGQTAACMKEWQEKKDYGFDEYMSPQFIYSNRRNDTPGMFSRDVMKILHKIGSVPEKEYPFGTNKPVTDELKKKAYKHHIAKYAAVHSIEGAKKALIKNGPLYMACPVWNYSSRFWKPKQGDYKRGGHALTIIGYNKEGFILRNSWGKRWGNNGYTIFPYQDFGLHWEIWTMIDADSGRPLPPVPANKKTFWERLTLFFIKLFNR